MTRFHSFLTLFANFCNASMFLFVMRAILSFFYDYDYDVLEHQWAYDKNCYENSEKNWIGGERRLISLGGHVEVEKDKHTRKFFEVVSTVFMLSEHNCVRAKPAWPPMPVSIFYDSDHIRSIRNSSFVLLRWECVYHFYHSTKYTPHNERIAT